MNYSKYQIDYIDIKIISQKYSDMKQRCDNTKCRLYKNYGAKGIKVKISKEQFYHWFLDNYAEFLKKFPNEIPSISRIDHSKDYEFGNIEIISVSANSEESYLRVGNPSNTGTVLDDMACLSIHTFPDKRTRFLATHYGVSYQAIRSIKKGTNRKHIYEAVK
jgi:hypothetical protein